MTVRERRDFSKADDAIIAMKGVEDEAKAYTDYMERAQETNDPKLKETLKDVAEEELVHLGEFKQRADEAIGNVDTNVDDGEEEATEGVKKAKSNKEPDKDAWETVDFSGDMSPTLVSIDANSFGTGADTEKRRYIQEYMKDAANDYRVKDEQYVNDLDTYMRAKASAKTPYERKKAEELNPDKIYKDQDKKFADDAYTRAVDENRISTDEKGMFEDQIDQAIRSRGSGFHKVLQSISPIINYATNGFAGADDIANGSIRWTPDQQKEASKLISQRFVPGRGAEDSIYNDYFDYHFFNPNITPDVDIYDPIAMQGAISTSGQLDALDSLIGALFKDDETYSAKGRYRNIERLAKNNPDALAVFMNYLGNSLKTARYDNYRLAKDKKRSKESIDFINSLPVEQKDKWGKILEKVNPKSFWSEMDKRGLFSGETEIPAVNIPEIYKGEKKALDDNSHFAVTRYAKMAKDKNNFRTYKMNAGQTRDAVAMHYALMKMQEEEMRRRAAGEPQVYQYFLPRDANKIRGKYDMYNPDGSEIFPGLKDALNSPYISDFIDDSVFNLDRLYDINDKGEINNPDKLSPLEQAILKMGAKHFEMAGSSFNPQEIIDFLDEDVWAPNKYTQTYNNLISKAGDYRDRIDKILNAHGASAAFPERWDSEGYETDEYRNDPRVVEARRYGKDAYGNFIKSPESMIDASKITSFAPTSSGYGMNYVPLDVLYMLSAIRNGYFNDKVLDMAKKFEAEKDKYGSQYIAPEGLIARDVFGNFAYREPIFRASPAVLHYLPQYLDKILDAYENGGFDILGNAGYTKTIEGGEDGVYNSPKTAKHGMRDAEIEALKSKVYGKDTAAALAKHFFNIYRQNKYLGPYFNNSSLRELQKTIYGDIESNTGDPKVDLMRKDRALLQNDPTIQELFPGAQNLYDWSQNHLYSNKGMNKILGSSGDYSKWDDGDKSWTDNAQLAEGLFNTSDQKRQPLTRNIPAKLLLNIMTQKNSSDLLRQLVEMRSRNDGGTYTDENWNEDLNNIADSLDLSGLSTDEKVKMGRFLNTVKPGFANSAPTADDLMYALYGKLFGYDLVNSSNSREPIMNIDTRESNLENYSDAEKALIKAFMPYYGKKRMVADAYRYMTGADFKNVVSGGKGKAGNILKKYKGYTNTGNMRDADVRRNIKAIPFPSGGFNKALIRYNNELKQNNGVASEDAIYQFLEAVNEIIQQRTPATNYFNRIDSYKEPIRDEEGNLNKEALVRSILEARNPYEVRRFMGDQLNAADKEHYIRSGEYASTAKEGKKLAKEMSSLFAKGNEQLPDEIIDVINSLKNNSEEDIENKMFNAAKDLSVFDKNNSIEQLNGDLADATDVYNMSQSKYNQAWGDYQNAFLNKYPDLRPYIIKEDDKEFGGIYGTGGLTSRELDDMSTAYKTDLDDTAKAKELARENMAKRAKAAIIDTINRAFERDFGPEYLQGLIDAKEKKNYIQSQLYGLNDRRKPLENILQQLSDEKANIGAKNRVYDDISDFLKNMLQTKNPELAEIVNNFVNTEYEAKLDKMSKRRDKAWKTGQRGYGLMGKNAEGYKAANILSNFFGRDWDYDKKNDSPIFTNPVALKLNELSRIDSPFMRTLVNSINMGKDPKMLADEKTMKDIIDKENRGVKSKYQREIGDYEYSGAKDNLSQMISNAIDMFGNDPNATIDDIIGYIQNDKGARETGLYNDVLDDWRDYIPKEYLDDPDSKWYDILERSGESFERPERPEITQLRKDISEYLYSMGDGLDKFIEPLVEIISGLKTNYQNKYKKTEKVTKSLRENIISPRVRLF